VTYIVLAGALMPAGTTLVTPGLDSRPAVPNREFPDPWGSETRFLGVRNAIFESESLYVLACIFFKRIEIYESLQVLLLKTTLSSHIIPATVTNLSC